MGNTREYKRSTRFSTFTDYEKEDLDLIIIKIKKTGLIPSGKYVSPSQIEPYLKELYFNIVDHTHTNMALDDLKIQFMNLSQPIQLSLVKRFWVGDSFVELQSIVAVKIMEILKNQTYRADKASLTSWIFENIYQILLKNFKDEKEYEKRQISLINFDLKMNSTE